MSESLHAARRGSGRGSTLLILGLCAIPAVALGTTFSSSHPSQPPALQGDGDRVPSVISDAGTAANDARRIELGRKIFFDPAMSEPAGTSCASCHDPARGFAGNNGSTIGVARGSRPGQFAKRNTPSVLYLKYVRRFHLHWEEDAPLVDAFGGFFWDGRTDSLTDLVKQPLLAPNEMNNGDAAHVAQKIRVADYSAEFRQIFGSDIDDTDRAMRALGEAINAYLTSPAMSPFSSKYDEYIGGRAQLTPIEAHGLALFKDSAKGGCAACHKMNDTIPNPERSLFTDYGYEALGAPRNRALPENHDEKHFDLGLCKRPDTHYHTDGEEFCGAFRTPSLRNVATRQRFMHNGVFTSLKDVVSFYATRSTTPKRWYTSGIAFEDVPEKYREYVNVDSAPYNRQEGEKPALDDSEIDAIVAFLGTLTDAQFR